MGSFNLQVSKSAVGGVITIGNFDGVHLGHQSMLARVCEAARRLNRPAVVVTFDPHPINVLKPEVRLPRLTNVATRKQLLHHYGADEVVVLPVSHELLDMTPEQFFADVVVAQLQAAAVVEGPDFQFGKDRAGDIEVLRSLCSEASIECTIIDPVQDQQQMISSTRVRALLQDGNASGAAELLGHPYQLSGRVVKGAERGRTLGFPTANLDEIEVLIPGDGVYSGECTVDGKTFSVAMNIGPNPTFGEGSRKVECHLVGFTGDLYGRSLDVAVFHRLRAPRSFGSAEELRAQIRQDVAASINR